MSNFINLTKSVKNGLLEILERAIIIEFRPCQITVTQLIIVSLNLKRFNR